MVETDIEIKMGNETLAGTVCLPDDKGCFPAVLLVHGSGPLDRNENARGTKLNIFNTIAHDLARKGIASLRYDKRGCGKSTGNYYATGHHDLVSDAIACLDTLKNHKNSISDKIFILGHSEGAVIAPQVSAKRRFAAGIILLCPLVQDLKTTLIKQAGRMQESFEEMTGLKGLLIRAILKLTGKPIEAQKKLIARLDSTSTPTIRFMGKKIPANWFREMFCLDLPEIYRQVECPTLLIGGEKDIQCDKADVDEIYKLVQGPASQHIIKDMSHILRCDDQPPSFLRYSALIKKPVEPMVLNLTSEWISAI